MIEFKHLEKALKEYADAIRDQYKDNLERDIVEFLNWMSYIKSYNAMNVAIQKEEANKGKKYY